MSTASKYAEMFVRLGLCFVFLILSTSCYSLGERKKGIEGLVQSVQTFNDAIRWEDYKAADVFLDSPSEKMFWDLADHLKRRVKITGYEIRRVTHQEKSPYADVLLSYRIYYTNDPYIRSINLHQQWAYNEKDKYWIVAQHGLQSLMPSQEQ